MSSDNKNRHPRNLHFDDPSLYDNLIAGEDILDVFLDLAQYNKMPSHWFGMFLLEGLATERLYTKEEVLKAIDDFRETLEMESDDFGLELIETIAEAVKKYYDPQDPEGMIYVPYLWNTEFHENQDEYVDRILVELCRNSTYKFSYLTKVMSRAAQAAVSESDYRRELTEPLWRAIAMKTIPEAFS